MRLPPILLTAVFVLAACSESGVNSPDPINGNGKDPPSPIETQSFVPTSISIEIDGLPEPYATPSAVKRADISAVPSSPLLYVPEGFQVNVFASGLTGPRSLALAPGGDVFVAESGSNRIVVLRDSTGDGDADLRTIFAGGGDGLTRPFGLVFAEQALYVGGTTSIRRFPYEPQQLQAADAGDLVATLTANSSGHWTRDLVLSQDGSEMYVSIGSASNVSVESPPRATVQQMGLDGSGRRTVAGGLRNPVGLAVHPVTGAVFTVVNERDGLGDELVPDFMAEVQPGAFYGWPFAYLRPDLLDPRRMSGGQSESPDLASSTKTPAVLFQAHSAPLGLTFYDGDSFPARYRNGAFVAFHGSWNRSRATGYKVVFVPFNPDGSPAGHYENFLTGFLVGETNPRTWGRPVDVLVLADGSLLVSEDANGMIYRIQYYP